MAILRPIRWQIPDLGRMQPLDGTVPRARAGGQAALEEIPACWRFPVDHLSGKENAWNPAQHEPACEFAPANASSRGDRFLKRPWSGREEVEILDLGSQHGGSGKWATGGQDGKGCITKPPAGARCSEHFVRVFW